METNQICECESCNETATHVDFMGNYICEEHMYQSIEEDGNTLEDFETI